MRGSRETLGAVWLKNGGDWQKAYQSIKGKEPLSDADYEAIEAVGIDYAAFGEDPFPKALMNVPRPPFTIFYEGDISLLSGSGKTLAIISGEGCSEATKKAAESIVSGLPKEILLAVPILGRVVPKIIESGISSGHRIIGIVPHDIRWDEPRYRALAEKITGSGGLLVSEYAKSETPIDANMQSRRILAGIADVVLCLDATKGRLEDLTIAFAMNCGKDIGCLPHEPQASRNNIYIKEGAALVENTEDVLLLLNTAHKEE